jgi:hypothetical protein
MMFLACTTHLVADEVVVAPCLHVVVLGQVAQPEVHLQTQRHGREMLMMMMMMMMVMTTRLVVDADAEDDDECDDGAGDI